MEKQLPKVYFRLDQGLIIGDGHLFRCKALASQLQKQGFLVTFLVRPRDGFSREKFEPFNVICLKEHAEKLTIKSTYDQWLSVGQIEDANECLELAGNDSKNIFIIDHYGIGASWESIMVERQQIVIAIDDLFRTHHAHIIIDHNVTANGARYTNSYPEATLLMGPEYALLREDICRSPDYDLSKTEDSFLIFLGAAEDTLLQKILNSVRKLNLNKLVILANSDFPIMENETHLKFCSDLPAIYRKQKLVFGSCGVAHLERMALGVPTVTAVIVENQEEVGKKIDELNVSYHIGDLRNISQVELEQEIKKSYDHLNDIQIKALKGKNLISKSGTFKIVQFIFSLIKE